MEKFTIRGYSLDYFEEEVEAENEEQAQNKLMEKLENGNIEPLEGTIFFETDNEFEVLEELTAEEDANE